MVGTLKVNNYIHAKLMVLPRTKGAFYPVNISIYFIDDIVDCTRCSTTIVIYINWWHR